MTTLNKVLLKEFQELNFKSFSENQIQITFPNEQDLTEVKVVLLPTGGPYAGGRFEFALKLPADYPNSTPKVTCTTKIFHPNVSYSGDVCFNLFSDEWDSCLRLVDYAHGLLWLLYQPNLSSRLNGDCPQNEQEFHKLVRDSLMGKTVAGISFPVNMITAESQEQLQSNVKQNLPEATPAS